MGDNRRDKKYLGVDTNVLVAFLDKQHPDHPEAKRLENIPNTATKRGKSQNLGCLLDWNILWVVETV